MSCANKAQPLLLPWTNITVSGNDRITRRGIGLGFGTPEQLISLEPSTSRSDVWLLDPTDCDDDLVCMAVTGGIYNISASSTITKMPKQAWNGNANTLSEDGSKYTYFNDVLHFNDSTFINSFPFFTKLTISGSQSVLGIGWNSTFLDTVVKSGIAPTRNWGLWAGSRSVIEPADGALCLGGYDSNRLKGEFTTFRGSKTCSSCVKVVNMTWVTQSHSTSLFSGQTNPFRAVISPAYDTMTLPAEVFQRFRLAINGTLSGTNALLTVPGDADLGSINITLQGGYTTVIPAQEIFLPPRHFNDDGIYEISNDTYLVSTVINATSDEYSLAFGMPFLTMNYMTMDFDWDTFSLAPARQGPYSDSDGPSIQPLCEYSTPRSSGPADPAPTDLQTLSDGSKRSRTDTTIVASVIVGGILGLALIGLLTRFIVMCRTKKEKSKEESYMAVANQTERAPKQESSVQVHRQGPQSWHTQMPVAASLDRSADQDELDYEKYDQSRM